MTEAVLEYALTRVQARYGQRPDQWVWQQLYGIREFAAFLEAARTTVLRPWLAGLGPESGVHDVELALRERLRGLIEELAGWMPQPWQGAVRWTVHLIDLPALAHLVRGEAPFEWMRRDASLKPYLDKDPENRRKAFLNSELAPIVLTWERGVSIRTAWLEEWRDRWLDNASDSPLDRLVALIEAHEHQFSIASPNACWMLREMLQRQFQWMFRRFPLHPIAAFVYLALTALDLERLRSELVKRLLFPKAGPAP